MINNIERIVDVMNQVLNHALAKPDANLNIEVMHCLTYLKIVCTHYLARYKDAVDQYRVLETLV